MSSTRELRQVLQAAPRACSEEPELFFAPDTERAAARQLRERAAVALCADCPVRQACLEYAVRNGERYGVWGGVPAYQLPTANELEVA
ncbi:WhiB family transcriptional regulator [Lipingzhangella sp. LS1_29]|uniref:Transcriptional regulator WhiB n=1 Tax=Lipingzhangella rawalii TaxID=2055835 RepID=A0ABU2H8C9_9ACTN|nr:WhiB family transcriptional regulator [Lipingzhangella rawalii]MDS1271551.1 WhiB family transcriptional regulator [Lipingzhangella rawalii]